MSWPQASRPEETQLASAQWYVTAHHKICGLSGLTGRVMVSRTHFHYTGEKAASLLLISYKLGILHFKQCGWMNSATGDRNNMKSLYQNPSSRIRRRLFYSTRCCFAVYQITCSFFQSHKRLFSSFPHMQSDSPTPVNTLMCVNVWMSGCCRRWRFHFRLTSSIQVVFQSSSPSRLMIRFR